MIVKKVKKVMDLLLPLINITIYKITNVSTPIDDSDATTKKLVADLLKYKTGTTYVNNELANYERLICIKWSFR